MDIWIYIYKYGYMDIWIYGYTCGYMHMYRFKFRPNVTYLHTYIPTYLPLGLRTYVLTYLPTQQPACLSPQRSTRAYMHHIIYGCAAPCHLPT